MTRDGTVTCHGCVTCLGEVRAMVRWRATPHATRPECDKRIKPAWLRKYQILQILKSRTSSESRRTNIAPMPHATRATSRESDWRLTNRLSGTE
jgi:hypothetical protein